MDAPTDVLLVEDDDAIAEVVLELLHEEGYRVVRAEHGAAALAFLHAWSRPPRLVLLDVMMPVMDGFQFRSIQRADAALSMIPVVVLSAFPPTLESAAELDPVAYLRKPFDWPRLLYLVRRYCDS